MGDEGQQPDSDMKIAVVASLSPQEAALLAGRLEAEGIRAMVSEGHGAPGPWTALPGGLEPLAPNPLQRGTAEVLVDERDIEKARRIADRYRVPLRERRGGRRERPERGRSGWVR
jgi:hypothetical protein